MTILFVGDVMLGENPHHQGRGIRSRYHGRYEALMAPEVRGNLLEGVQCVIFNLEGVLEEGEGLWPGGAYAADIGSLSVWGPGVRLVANVANNHFMEHGERLAAETMRLLEERGVIVIGGSREGNVVWSDPDSGTVRVWGASVVPDGKNDVPYVRGPLEDILDELVLPEHKGRGDTWVLAIHWGSEYASQPSPEQWDFARAAASRGFDVVAGHHPHVVQPVARVGGAWVFFSLGNFLFDQNFSRRTRHGLAVRLPVGTGGMPEFWITRQDQDYRITSARPTDPGGVEALAKAWPWESARAMRFLMKWELLVHCTDVPRWAWRGLLRRWTGRARWRR